MTRNEPTRSLAELAKDMGRFPPEAFAFVSEALQFTIEHCRRGEHGQRQHVSGQDLCWGLRDFALKRWGLLAPAVLRSWNIRRTEDFGTIVFAMIEAGWMAKTDQDDISDFNNVYDFETAFKPRFKIE